MPAKKNPLKTHLRTMFELRKTMDVWNTGRQIITIEHLRNIQRMVSTTSDDSVEHKTEIKDLPSISETNDSSQFKLVNEVFIYTDYLKKNPKLSDQEKLRHIEQITNQALKLNLLNIYLSIIGCLDHYLERTLRLDINISAEELYVEYLKGLKVSGLCHQITYMKDQLPIKQYEWFIKKIADIEGFNPEDFKDYPEIQAAGQTKKLKSN